jgi:beta-lactam-binding protein with PASTA domain
MKIWNLLKNNIYAKNIFWAVLVTIILFSGLNWWLRSYTRHGQAIVVPDVRGLSVQEASAFFNNSNLRFEVVDSVHNRNVNPGAIVETVPTAGTKVKEYRNIYITINAYSSRASIVPEVKDQSSRQAIARLNAAEFSDIQVRYVSAPFRDLVIGLEYRGREVITGERLPLDSRLVLLVSDGTQSITPFEEDSIESNTAISVEESWFN